MKLNEFSKAVPVLEKTYTPEIQLALYREFLGATEDRGCNFRDLYLLSRQGARRIEISTSFSLDEYQRSLRLRSRAVTSAPVRPTAT